MAQPPSPLSTPLAWDLVADGYTTDVVPELERFATEALELAKVAPGERVLDVASGPGTLALLAARTAKVTALDFSSPMLFRLEERAASAGLSLAAEVGNGMALPFGEGAFDAAFSMFGLMFFPDRGRGFRELYRVLRPEGRAVVSSWVPMDRAPLLAELFASLQAELPELPFPSGKAPLSEKRDVEEEMSVAGFRNVRVSEISHSVEYPSLRAFMDSSKRSNAPFVFLKHTLGAERWGALAQAVAKRLEAKFGPGPGKLDLIANLGIGVK